MSRRAAREVRYAGASLDRAADRRSDAEWIAAMAADPRARVLPIWRDKNLVANLVANLGGPDGAGGTGAAPIGAPSDASPHAGPPAGPRAGAWAGPPLSVDDRDGRALTFLGIDATGPVFAADVSHLEGTALAAGAAGGTFLDLRHAGPLVDAHDAALMAFARAITGWHRRARYCGVCGAATESRQGGHMRRCRDASCGAELFPRTDPAVIMLVEHPADTARDARCLLAHHNRLPPRSYTTLAGFVEPGETLEQAVAREVLEETGVRIAQATYLGSQPWPFPHSLMIGFRAVAEAGTSDAITVDRAELEDARWFTATELDRFGEWGDTTAEYQLPRRDSIARMLVEAWRAEHAEGVRPRRRRARSSRSP